MHSCDSNVTRTKTLNRLQDCPHQGLQLCDVTVEHGASNTYQGHGFDFQGMHELMKCLH